MNVARSGAVNQAQDFLFLADTHNTALLPLQHLRYVTLPSLRTPWIPCLPLSSLSLVSAFSFPLALSLVHDYYSITITYYYYYYYWTTPFRN